MKMKIDVTGKQFDLLTVLRFVGKAKSNSPRSSFYDCVCKCGEHILATSYELRIGRIRSCGRCSKVTHGNSRQSGHTKEYAAWQDAKNRCFNPNIASYKYVGARGLTMCDRWVNSFPAFLSDMGLCPAGLTLDRINNDGNYEPTNCRWAIPKQQANNRRTNKVYPRQQP